MSIDNVWNSIEEFDLYNVQELLESNKATTYMNEIINRYFCFFVPGKETYTESSLAGYFNHDNNKDLIDKGRKKSSFKASRLLPMAAISYYIGQNLEKYRDYIDSAFEQTINCYDGNEKTDYAFELNCLKKSKNGIANLFFVYFCLNYTSGNNTKADGDDKNLRIKRNTIKKFINEVLSVESSMRRSIESNLKKYSNRVAELANKEFKDIYVETDYESSVKKIIESLQTDSLEKFSFLVQGAAQSGKSMILQKLALNVPQNKTLVFLNSSILNSFSNLPTDFSSEEESKSFLYNVYRHAYLYNNCSYDAFFGYDKSNHSSLDYETVKSQLKTPHSIVYIIDALDELNSGIKDLVLKSIDNLMSDGGISCSIVLSTRKLSKKTMESVESSLHCNPLNAITIKGFSKEAKRRLFEKLKEDPKSNLEEIQYEDSETNEYLSSLTNNPFLFTKYLISDANTPFDLVCYICDDAGINPTKKDIDESLLDVLGRAAEHIYLGKNDSFKLRSDLISKENDLIKTGIVVPKEGCDGNEYVFVNSLFAGYIYALYLGDALFEIGDKNIDYDFLMAFMFDPDKMSFPSKPTLIVNQSVVFHWACNNSSIDKGNFVCQILKGKYSKNYFAISTYNDCPHHIIRAVFEKEKVTIKNVIENYLEDFKPKEIF